MASSDTTSPNAPDANAPEGADGPADAPLAVGAVSYLNTLPLIDGLDRLDGLVLRRSVPSRLVDALVNREVEVALCSSIDYQRAPIPLRLVPVGMLGCHGATLTVRLFSQVPLERLELVHVDADSHTSVALMQVLLAERFGARPSLVPFDVRERAAENRIGEHPEGMLLIGDKVVGDSPPAVRYPYQLDLGAAWSEWTGLPFVFATWMARADADPERIGDIAAILDRQRRHNRERLRGIVDRRAESRGWPRDLALRYLGSCLRYDLDEPARAGLDRFFECCAAHGLIERSRPVELFEAPAALR
ncbi:MAG TPA: menaquinone biosynthesis protein [Phycisphaerales bacterium]|nr:menaquinone biosynthesis protein [Phycisphaerales bacterium]HMP36400.1 menaquinone biosynthesis protein [Phycisphaerales bacterium]